MKENTKHKKIFKEIDKDDNNRNQDKNLIQSQ